MGIDHVIYATTDLDAAAARVQSGVGDAGALEGRLGGAELPGAPA